MLIASSSSDVKFHEWADGKLLYSYKPLTQIEGPVKSISWGKDGTWMVLVPYKGRAEVVSLKNNIKPLHTIQDIQQPTCAAFQNNTKKNIAVATLTGQVLLYDMKSRSIKKRFPRSSSNIFYIEYSAKDRHIVAACENGEVLLYSNVTNNLSTILKISNSASVTTVRYHRTKSHLLVGGSEEGMIAVWDTNTNKHIFSTQAHNAPISGLAFSPIRGDLLITLGLDRKFCFYDAVSNKCIVQTAVERSMTAVDFAPDGLSVAMSSHGGLMYIYDTRNLSKPVRSFHGHNSKVNQLFFQHVPAENISLYDISEESVLKTCRSDETSSAISADTDSIGDILKEDIGKEEKPNSLGAGGCTGDSFMVALGMEWNNTSIKHESAVGVTEGVKKWMEASKTNVLDPPASSQESKLTLNSVANVKQLSSTPKYVSQEMPESTASPIVTQNQTLPPSNTQSSTDINILKEAVATEVKSEIARVRGDIVEMFAQMRRHFLDLQMTIVKEFVQMESNLESLRQNLAVEEMVSDNYLMKENARLRDELETMKDMVVSRDKL